MAEALAIKSEKLSSMTDEELLRFCHDNEHLRVERDSQGLIYIMAPTFTETGLYNNNISFELTLWNRRSALGYVFDSSTGFKLPNGSMRSPDASWISKQRWESLASTNKKGFAQICPDFVIELKSSSDSLDYLRDKMEDWLQNGCHLGWILDLEEKTCHVFRPNSAIILISFPSDIQADDVLPDFKLTWESIGF